MKKLKLIYISTQNKKRLGIDLPALPETATTTSNYIGSCGFMKSKLCINLGYPVFRVSTMVKI